MKQECNRFSASELECRDHTINFFYYILYSKVVTINIKYWECNLSAIGTLLDLGADDALKRNNHDQNTGDERVEKHQETARSPQCLSLPYISLFS